MGENLFCSRCRKWKDHNWHRDEKRKIMVLKCSKCNKNKEMKVIDDGDIQNKD